jgi:hypothetical protein
VAVLGVGMRVGLSRVSRGRGRIFLSLPSSVAQGVSLIVVLILFWCSGFFRKTATFMSTLLISRDFLLFWYKKVAVFTFH